MPVYSMTGYASTQTAGPASATEADPAARTQRQLGLEIRSVNSRFLDLTFRLPDELRAFEPLLREWIGARLKRGKVEIRASLSGTDNSALPELSPHLLQRLNSLQDSIRAWLPQAQPLGVAEVLRLAATEQTAPADWSQAMAPAAEQALQELLQARQREGERLAAMLRACLAQLHVLVERAQPLVPALVEQQRNRFLERWRDAMALAEGASMPESARERALTEATAYAIRIDVAEELTRLRSHLQEIERLLAKGGEIGKRLDFLIQELHREANTLGSKSALLEMTQISVDMKVLIEQMREQVQNIE